LAIERSKFSGVSQGVIFVLVSVLFFAHPAHPRVAPYVAEIAGEKLESGGGGGPRLIGTFKIFNPDTVPFFLWVSFGEGGKPAARVADLEIRCKSPSRQTSAKWVQNEGGRFDPGVLAEGIQAYYEMELWGVAAKGVKGLKLEIEVAH
jgi:hypothetical protein